MKITILTIGSRGDVQPYIALGVGLKNAGYDVCLATHDTFQDLIIKSGLNFFRLSGDIQSLSSNENGKKMIESGGNPLNAFKNFSATLEPLMAETLNQSWLACQDADLVISGTVAFWGFDIAQKLGIPFAYALLQPIYSTRSFINPLFPPGLSLTGWINKQSYTLINHIFWRFFRDFINQWRVETLNIPASNECLLLMDDWDKIPKIFGYSPAVIPTPNDWNNSCFMTGYWFLESANEFQPPPELLDFLNSGEPPVYVGFGSMASRNPQEMTEITLAALKKTQQRGILLTGWGGISNADLPDSVFKLDAIPHD